MLKDEKTFNQLLEIRLTIKRLEKMSLRAEAKAKTEKTKVAAAVRKSNVELARVHASNAIRCQREASSYLRLSAQLEGVRSKIESAAISKQVATQIAGVVKTMDSALATSDVARVATTMERFEQRLDDLHVMDDVVAQRMHSSTSAMAPEADVAALIEQVADANALDLRALMPQALVDKPQAAPTAATAAPASAAAAAAATSADVERVRMPALLDE